MRGCLLTFHHLDKRGYFLQVLSCCKKTSHESFFQSPVNLTFLPSDDLEIFCREFERRLFKPVRPKQRDPDTPIMGEIRRCRLVVQKALGCGACNSLDGSRGVGEHIAKVDMNQ